MAFALNLLNSGAIVVPRDRFAPVKTCADLFVLRSDVFRIAEDATVQAVTKQASGTFSPCLPSTVNAFSLQHGTISHRS